jgi:hypothetical protein
MLSVVAAVIRRTKAIVLQCVGVSKALLSSVDVDHKVLVYLCIVGNRVFTLLYTVSGVKGESDIATVQATHAYTPKV